MTPRQFLRIATSVLLLTLAALSTPLANANCGGCGGEKKECPSPTPTPSPTR